MHTNKCNNKKKQIIKRRKAEDKDKKFKCTTNGCHKSYLSNESLYTHTKNKHQKQPIKFLIPTKNEAKPHCEKQPDENVHKIVINLDTINILAKNYFLNFFKEMKNLADLDYNFESFFNSEKSSFTNLNDNAFFNQNNIQN